MLQMQYYLAAESFVLIRIYADVNTDRLIQTFDPIPVLLHVLIPLHIDVTNKNISDILLVQMLRQTLTLLMMKKDININANTNINTNAIGN